MPATQPACWVAMTTKYSEGLLCVTGAV